MPSSTAEQRYPRPSPPGLGLLSLLSQAPPVRALNVTSLSPLPSLLLQTSGESLKPTEPEEDTAVLDVKADSDSYNAEASAAMLDVLAESDASDLEHVSSLWLGLEPHPGDHVPPEARSTGHLTAF